MGGCLPMLLQMPIFFSFFYVLQTAAEFRGEGFIGWVTDLSQMDTVFSFPFMGYEVPVNILPILMATSTIIQMHMTPATGEDTLTFDGNGGENTPEAAKVTVNTAYTIPETAPTLEGDTFLGWSLIPYNTVPDYKAGDSLTLTGDTTLYAVWEKRSAELADAAFAEGKAPLMTRPESIQNSAALLLGTLTDLSVLTGKDTEIKTVTDDPLGKVISLTSTAQSDDPYITLDYAALTESLMLAPVTADKATYAVLKIKNISLNNTAVELSVNGSDKAVTVLLEDGNDWQYLVFDLTEAGFAGELTSLRIDWEKAANEAGNTAYLADIFFVSTEGQVDALTKGQYIFPVQPVAVKRCIYSVSQPGETKVTIPR